MICLDEPESSLAQDSADIMRNEEYWKDIDALLKGQELDENHKANVKLIEGVLGKQLDRKSESYLNFFKGK